MDKARVVDGERCRRLAKAHEPGRVVEDPPPPWIGQALEIHGILLLIGMTEPSIMLIDKLFPSQDHRNAHGGQQTRERELHPFFLESDVVVLQEIEETLFLEALNIMRRDIIDRLCAVFEPELTTGAIGDI